MDIVEHRLDGAEFRALKQGTLAEPPRYIVLHNTAGGSVQGSYDHLKKVGFSYHVLVDRTGKPLQCVPFDRSAGHAGKSNWRGRNSLNGFALGISAANFTADQVVEARHRNGGGEFGWEKYPPAQVHAMLEICRALVAEYPSIVDIIGHDDIAVGRKVDPGPAFPMEPFHALVPGRMNDPGPRLRVNTPGDTLSLRAAPVKQAAKIADLPDGTRLHLRSRAYTYVSPTKAVENGWASVNLGGDLKHDGFVHTDFLVPA
jgi:N-acetylmuramoyl-L-alanine amidase